MSRRAGVSGSSRSSAERYKWPGVESSFLLHKHLQENVVQPHFREEIAKHIIQSEEILFYWSILSAP